MLRYLLRRLGYSLLLLWGVATLVFLLFNALPVKTAQQSGLASIKEEREVQHSQKPFWTRYGLYLNDLSPIGVTSFPKDADAPVFHLTRVSDSSFLSLKAPFLGHSYRTMRPVSEILQQALPGTIVLASAALLLAVIFGIGLGVLGALKQNTFWDRSAIAFSVAGISMPSFFAGLIIALIFGYLLNSFTGLHIAGSLYELDKFGNRHLALRNLILPAFALSIRPMALFIHLSRASLLGVLSQNYIRTAYAKGLGKTRVVLRHALPNALSPVVAATWTWLAELLIGSFFIEYIFGWDGIGRTAVEALDKSDYPIVSGAMLLTALLFISISFLTDVVNGILDPRVRS